MTKPIEDRHPFVVHGTCVSLGERAALITGPSGSGKSALALQLMAYGADLIADDQVELFLNSGDVWARKPKTLPALIEARGVGLLRALVASPHRIMLVVDMSQVSKDRMPEPKTTEILGQTIMRLDKVDVGHFPAAVLHYLKVSD